VSEALQFRRMLAGDAVLLEMQPSQQLELGIEHPCYTLEEGEELAAETAWTGCRGARIVAIGGFRELFMAGSGEAIAWVTLGRDVGADHLALTRFVKRTIADARFVRIVAVVETANTSARVWASLVGLVANRSFMGAGGKTYTLFERKNP
jgi:hypothetical protein